MEKCVRISTVEKHEESRVEDMKKMTPKHRLEVLIELRDRLYPYASLERTVSYRDLN